MSRKILVEYHANDSSHSLNLSPWSARFEDGPFRDADGNVDPVGVPGRSPEEAIGLLMTKWAQLHYEIITGPEHNKGK